MRRLRVFESITGNGYFSGPGGDLGWAYATSGDPEFRAFVNANASRAAVLLFGRVTYQMMESYWPTAAAAADAPDVAKAMNAAEKIVFSRTMKKAAWRNSTLVKANAADAVKQLKQQPGDDLVVLGSGTLVRALSNAGLVDEIQLVVKPIALGGGRTLFEGIEDSLPLVLTSARTFRDGNVVLDYARAT